MWLKSLALVALILPYCTFAQTSIQLSYEKARSAYQQKNYDESIIHIKNVLQQDSTNLPAQTLMAQVLTQIGEYQTANSYFEQIINSGVDFSLYIDSWAQVLTRLKQYQQIVEFKPPSSLSHKQQVDWQYVRVNACLKLPDYDCAKQSYLQLTKLTNNPVEQLNGLANIAYLQQDYAKAGEYLTQALEKAPNNVATLHLMALLNKQAGLHEKALEQLLAAKSIAPKQLSLLKTLADVYLAKNDTNNASLVIEQILQLSPQDPFAILVNSQLTHASAEKSQQALEQLQQLAEHVYVLPDEIIDEEPTLLLLRGLLSFTQNKYQQALRDFRVLTEQKPQDMQAVMLLARTQLALKQNKDAVDLMELHQKSLLQYPSFIVLLGEQYLNSGKTFKALVLLEDLQQHHPEQIDVQLLEIKILLARQQTELALSMLDTLVEKHTNSHLLFIHSVLNLQAKRLDVALKSINQLLVHASNNEDYLTTKAAILIQQRALVEATQITQQTLTLNAESISARFNLASIYYQQNKFEQALKELERIHQQQPLHQPTLTLLAEIDVKAGNYQQAIERYLAVLTLEPENISALDGMFGIYLAQKQLNDAIKTLDKLVSITAAEPKYLLQRAYLYLAVGNEKSSALDSKMLATSANDDPILLLALSQLYLSQQDIVAAENSLRRILELQPNHAKVTSQLIELLLNGNQTAKAETEINKQLKLNANSASLYILAGRMYEQKGEIVNAAFSYKRALSLDDTLELALAKLYNLTRFGLDEKIFTQQVQQLIEQHPQRYFPINLLAQYYYYNQHWSLAAQQYEKLLQHPSNPNRAALLNRLANIYMQLDIDKSQLYIRQAIELDKQDQHIQKTYGVLLAQKGQSTEALGYLRKAFVKMPNDLDLRYHIAKCLADLGLVSEAKDELGFILSQQQSEHSNKAQLLLDSINSNL
ncbi:XrtA/PEP-CTERM system TPR-repeat protein PrsT [Catenovulum agarivorans]|uniref:XrtA/PEP-CTERM system TPR-repeat protein PrsT n=1 Tax=Catenovulum agarivorans TaxID=1172192 RepID=UPI0002D3B902|nr:XrtA/PEP-CTERM system TPR-repeat protein PrsT [Catenovulum agarivorans]